MLKDEIEKKSIKKGLKKQLGFRGEQKNRLN
jgi:hypothetical protein